MSSSPPDSSIGRRELPLAVLIGPLVLVAVGLRVGWVAYRYATPAAAEQLEFPDERDYWSMARSLAAGQTMRDTDGRCATRMPGYPAFLSLWAADNSAIRGARLTQAVIGSSLVLFVVLLANRLGGRQLAAIAGLLVAADPFSVFFSGLLLSETLATAALWLFVWLVWEATGGSQTRFWLCSGGASVALVLACYLHPSMALIAPLVLVGLLARSRARRRGSAAAAVMVSVAILALAPWASRNSRRIGQWRWLTTRGGISLYDGVGPLADGSSNLAYTRELPEAQGLDEVEWDRYFRGESLRLIREDPARLLRLAWPKLRRTWSPVPNAADYKSVAYRLISAAWMVPVMLLALLGLWSWRRRWPDALMLLLPAIGLTALHVILPGSVRYRLPAMPGIELLAAVGLCHVLRRLGGRHPRTGLEGIGSDLASM